MFQIEGSAAISSRSGEEKLCCAYPDFQRHGSRSRRIGVDYSL
jgi:hypothetical protein